MNYKEYEVPDSLRDFIKCFWSLDAGMTEKEERQRIVPDGCMELIVHYGDLYKQYQLDGSSILQTRSFVFGQITTPLEIAATGITGMVAARFQPDGFIPFSAYPIKLMENTAVPVNLLFGGDAFQLEAAVINAKQNEKRILILSRFLSHKLREGDTVDRVIKMSLDTLMQSNGHINIEKLSDKMKINRRQLERKFSSAIGLSPKQLSKVIRLQKTLKMLTQNNTGNLTDIAYENGYFDQAHFIKDFKEFTGVSPKAFYSENLKMNSLFVGSD